MKILIGLILLLSQFSVFASPLFLDSISIGVDGQLSHMHFKEGVKSSGFNRNCGQFNFYILGKVNPWLGVEVGFERGEIGHSYLHIQKKYVSIDAKMTRNTFVPHVDVVFFYPLNHEGSWNVFGGVGVSLLTSAYSKAVFSISGNELENPISETSEYKESLRLRIGVEALLSENIGVRSSIGWNSTGKVLVFNDKKGKDAFLEMLRPRNTIVYSLGLFWRF